MNGFFQALQFLTILRFKKETHTDTKDLSTSAAYFPLVGALLGAILIILNQTLSIILPQTLLNLTLITTLIVLSGALHLDGLADTFDALASARPKEEKLTIMRDSHKGTFGVLSIILILLFKFNLLSLMPANFKNLGLFLMTSVSRYSMNFAITNFSYARQDGKAKIFFVTKTHKIFWLSTLFTLIIILVTLKWISVIILFLVMSFTLIISTLFKKALGGLTGDTLGALCELNELVILSSIFVYSQR